MYRKNAVLDPDAKIVGENPTANLDINPAINKTNGNSCSFSKCFEYHPTAA